MPESAVLEAPAAAPSTPSTPETPASPGVLDQMDSMLSTFDKPDEPAKPETPAAPAKPADEATPAKPADKTLEKPAAPSSGPAQLRKRLEEVEKEYAGFKLTAQQEKEKLSKQMAEYEKRPFLTEEQQKRYEALEQRQKDMEASLYARDYRESPEFAEKYTKKWEGAYKSATQRVNGVTVTGENPETGEATTRKTSPHDFEKVRLAAPEEQVELAEKLFGKYAFIVMQDINALRGIEDAANEEIATRAKTYHSQRQELQQRLRQHGQAYESAHAEIDRQLAEKYPAYFGDDPANPEASAEMKKGLAIVDETLAQADNLPVNERAAKAALIRRWAAAFPRLVYTTKQLQAQLKAKDEELAKYRKSDPGSGGDSGSPAPKTESDEDLKLDNLASKFDA